MTTVTHNRLAAEHEGYDHVGIPPRCPACAQTAEAERVEWLRQVRRRRRWRRFWDVVTIIVVGVMLFASGYLLGHAHEVVVYRTPMVVE